MTHNFEQCPLCDIPWEFLGEKKPIMFIMFKTDGKCKCGLFYRPTEWVFKIFSNGVVRWGKANTCDIVSGTITENGIKNSKEIPVDFLPYDITQEQLKLYLTFS